MAQRGLSQFTRSHQPNSVSKVWAVLVIAFVVVSIPAEYAPKKNKAMARRSLACSGFSLLALNPRS
jgi:hypothetical protein